MHIIAGTLFDYEIQRHARLVAHHPAVVARTDLERFAGVYFVLVAVRIASAEYSRQYIADMPFGLFTGLHADITRPAPARQVGAFADKRGFQLGYFTRAAICKCKFVCAIIGVLYFHSVFTRVGNWFLLALTMLSIQSTTELCIDSYVVQAYEGAAQTLPSNEVNSPGFPSKP